MNVADFLHDSMIGLGIVFLADLIVCVWLGTALRRLRGQQIREIHTPSQLTHRQPGSISERSGKGDEAAFHSSTDKTETGDNHA